MTHCDSITQSAVGSNLAWYMQFTGNQISANSFPTTPFSTPNAVFQAYSVPGGTPGNVTFSPATAYQVRVRALGQWGYGIWSSPLSVTTWGSLQTPNALTSGPTQVSASSNGGLFTFSANANNASGNLNNIIGRTLTGFAVQWSCTNLLNGSLCPSGSQTWNTSAGTVTNITTGGRIAGGTIVIGDATNATNTALGYYVRVAAINSGSSTAGTASVQGAWTYSAITAANQAVSWATAAITISVTGNINAGVSGSYSIQGCWGTGTAGAGSSTACQATIKPPAIIGGGGFGAYSVTGTSSASFGTTPTFNYATFTFILSGIATSTAIDIAVTNNVTPAVAATSTGTATTPSLQNAATATSVGSVPGAPVFVTRSGAADANGSSFLVQGKGSSSIAWAAVRVRRPINSGANSWGWNSGNTASAIGQLTWLIGPFSYASAAITTAGTAGAVWQCDTGFVGGLVNGGYGATFPFALTVAGTLTAAGVSITTAATGCTSFPTVSLNPSTAGTLTALTVKITTGANAAAAVTGATGSTAVYTVGNFVSFPTGASPTGWACTTSPGIKVTSITGNFPTTVDLTTAPGGVCTVVKFNSNGGIDITGWCSGATVGAACDASTTLTDGYISGTTVDMIVGNLTVGSAAAISVLPIASIAATCGTIAQVHFRCQRQHCCYHRCRLCYQRWSRLHELRPHHLRLWCCCHHSQRSVHCGRLSHCRLCRCCLQCSGCRRSYQLCGWYDRHFQDLRLCAIQLCGPDCQLWQLRCDC